MEVKDSGSAIPAFGGLLDILDSLLISIPVAYYFLVIIGY
jgi:phosphatidate cytidylyltransferase